MSFWKRRRRLDLEGELTELRPEPRNEFLRTLSAQVRSSGAPAAQARRGSLRVAFAGALVAGVLAAVASVGGISYAASVAKNAVRAVQHAVAPAKPTRVVAPVAGNAGGDQYRPGFGFGDRNHFHTGPPGLNRRGGPNAPPTRARKTADGKAYVVTGVFNVDEQADLRFSVTPKSNNFTEKDLLLLTQNGSFVGASPFTGEQAKILHYVLLIPRTGVTVRLRVPANLLKSGQRYNILVRVIPPLNAGPPGQILLPFIVP